MFEVGADVNEPIIDHSVDSEAQEDDEDYLDWGAVYDAVERYCALRSAVTTSQASQNEIKKDLNELVGFAGYTDDKGHVRLDLPRAVAGIRAIVRQRSTRVDFDENAAEEILKSKTTPDGSTLWDACTDLVPVLDDDKVLAARYDDLLNDEDIDRIYPKKITYSLVTEKDTHA